MLAALLLPVLLAGVLAGGARGRRPRPASGGEGPAGGAGPAVGARDSVRARVLVTSSPSTRVRVVAPAAARATAEGAPARAARPGAAADTLLLATPARFEASLDWGDVRIEAVDSTAIDVEAIVDRPARGPRLHGGAGARVYVLRAGGRGMDVPGALHRGIEELGGDPPPPPRDSARRRPPPAAPFRAREVSAWGGHATATVYFARGDTVVTLELAFARPPRPGRGPAERRAVGAGAPAAGVTAYRLTGPRAAEITRPAAVPHPERERLRAEAAVAGAVTVTPVWRGTPGAELGVDSVAVTVHRLDFAAGVPLRTPLVTRPVYPPPP